MKLLEHSRGLAGHFMQEIEFYGRVLEHPHTPRAARLLLGAAMAQAAYPLDLIPGLIYVDILSPEISMKMELTIHSTSCMLTSGGER